MAPLAAHKGGRQNHSSTHNTLKIFVAAWLLCACRAPDDLDAREAIISVRHEAADARQ